MKFGVVIFPGSNCDMDIIHVLTEVTGESPKILWHKDTDLGQLGPEDMIILPGGFSFGDYLRGGAIARFSPIMQSLIAFAESGGKVFGICNGFQVLCEAGLLPGTLLRNNGQKFVCKNVLIKAETNNSIITSSIPNDKLLKIPIAHAEGRYYARNEILKELESNEQVLFRYCDDSGEPTTQSNPNGSLNNIAGICNDNRNVFGMMPHPERASESALNNTDGLYLFESILSESLINQED